MSKDFEGLIEWHFQCNEGMGGDVILLQFDRLLVPLPLEPLKAKVKNIIEYIGSNYSSAQEVPAQEIKYFRYFIQVFYSYHVFYRPHISFELIVCWDYF